MQSSACDLLLVRHGVTEWNETGRLMGWADVPLNVRGRAEARAVARALRTLPVETVVASPQRRAQETAARIAKEHGLAVRTDAALSEVWVGRWQGCTWDELRDDADVRRLVRDPMHECEHLESVTAVQQRMVGAAEQLLQERVGERVVLVSHGDPIKVLVAHYLGMALSGFRRIMVDTGSVSVIRFVPGWGARLLVANWKPPGTLPRLLGQRDPVERHAKA